MSDREATLAAIAKREADLARVAKMNAAKAAKKAEREAAAAALAKAPVAATPPPPAAAPVQAPVVPALPDSDHSDSDSDNAGPASGPAAHVISGTVPAAMGEPSIGEGKYFRKYKKLMKRHDDLLHAMSTALSFTRTQNAAQVASPAPAPPPTVPATNVQNTEPPRVAASKPPVQTAAAKAAARQQVADHLLRTTMSRVFG